MSWLTRCHAWLGGKLASAGSWITDLVRPAYRTRVVIAELPEVLKKRTLYIVEEDGFEEQAALLCPCGRNHILHLNLLPDERPLWRVTRHKDGTTTLHPSVWRKKDCHSHFWFRRGRVHWLPVPRTPKTR